MKKNYKCWLLLFLLLNSRLYAQEDNVMYAHYINVGQAAAVLLEFPCGAILIDAGAQDATYEDKLVSYIGNFFKKRKDLDSTLALVMVTHPHIDHNEALETIAKTFKIKGYIDDGLQVGSGRVNQKWMQENAKTNHIPYESFSFEQISAGGNKKGVTDAVIDPINCTNGDPKITLYSGRFDKQPEDWTQTDFKNYNNHSLVIKVQFGKSSFLFTGDLEEKGINNLVTYYKPTGRGRNVLDVDVLMVGHHGAANATTEDYLNAVTPLYAVISCGEWNYGQGGTDKFTTYYYGHPRISTINMLNVHVPGNRSASAHVKAADGATSFRYIDVNKNIYATPWDQNVVVKATYNGEYQINTDN